MAAVRLLCCFACASALLLLSGCGAPEETLRPGMRLLAKAPNYYAVEEETRVVLLGSYDAYRRFIESGETGPVETLGGMADAGKDLLVQSTPDDPAQADALTQQYLAGRRYFEAERDEAIYVLGRYETLLRLREEGGLPDGCVRPLADDDETAEAPDADGAKPVVIEQDESDPALAERLRREYLQRHGQPSS